MVLIFSNFFYFKDLGAILNLNEFEPLNGHVSWTDRPINYYFQKIDRTLVQLNLMLKINLIIFKK